MFKLFFATPDKKIVSDQELAEITFPAFAGELNILPGHAPLMTTLEPGILQYKLKNGESQRMAISWGYCQISADGVTVLAETAVLAEEVDAKVVSHRLADNEALLIGESMTDEEWEKTQHEVKRLRAELNLLSETQH